MLAAFVNSKIATKKTYLRKEIIIGEYVTDISRRNTQRYPGVGIIIYAKRIYPVNHRLNIISRKQTTPTGT